MEWETAVVSCLSANTITVNDRATLVKGFYVNTALSAHQAEFRDNGVMTFKTPSSAGEGDAVDWDAARSETNCVVFCAASMTGNFTVLYKDLARE